MDYNLCKQLKDAGFPQPNFKQNQHLSWSSKAPQDHHDFERTLCYDPILSELIEACGDILLYKLPKNNQWDSSEKGVWVASEIREYLCADTYFIDTSFTGQIGTTPEELESFFRPTLSGILQPTTPKIRISF